MAGKKSREKRKDLMGVLHEDMKTRLRGLDFIFWGYTRGFQ